MPETSHPKNGDSSLTDEDKKIPASTINAASEPSVETDRSRLEERTSASSAPADEGESSSPDRTSAANKETAASSDGVRADSQPVRDGSEIEPSAEATPISQRPSSPVGDASETENAAMTPPEFQDENQLQPDKNASSSDASPMEDTEGPIAEVSGEAALSGEESSPQGDEAEDIALSATSDAEKEPLSPAEAASIFKHQHQPAELASHAAAEGNGESALPGDESSPQIDKGEDIAPSAPSDAEKEPLSPAEAASLFKHQHQSAEPASHVAAEGNGESALPGDESSPQVDEVEDTASDVTSGTEKEPLSPAEAASKTPTVPEEKVEDSDSGAVPSVQDTSGLSADELLEEQHFDTTTEDKGLREGIIHVMGNDQYHIEASLPRGYYKALRARGEHPVILTVQPLDSLWVEDDHPLQHPRLPSILYAGEDGVALDEVKGDPVPRGLPLHEAVSLLNGVALLLRFLSVKGLAVTDIDLSGLVRTADGVRLQYLPTLARMGQPAQVTFGDGTPLEGSATESATEATSMFLWGAMLCALVTGENLPAEGLDRQTLSQMKTPGLPQLLNAAMRDRSACPDLRALREICQAFQRPPSPKYQIGAASTIGLNPSRLCNEDSYGLAHHAWEYHDQDWQCLRACVADGMGGEAAGEIASQAAVNAFCQRPAPDRLERTDVHVQWTRELGWEANRAVQKAVGDAGGGCTLTGIVVVNDRLALAHVGDSRAYLHSARKGLELLSRDHSLVRALLDSGNMSADEAATSSLINQVTRALGQPMPEDYVDSLAHLVDAKGQSIREAHLALETGDRILLMSDGIWGVWEYRDSVITAELTKIIDAADAAGSDPQALADALIQCALDAGADDNATVVVVARIA